MKQKTAGNEDSLFWRCYFLIFFILIVAFFSLSTFEMIFQKTYVKTFLITGKMNSVTEFETSGVFFAGLVPIITSDSETRMCNGIRGHFVGDEAEYAFDVYNENDYDSFSVGEVISIGYRAGIFFEGLSTDYYLYNPGKKCTVQLPASDLSPEPSPWSQYDIFEFM